MKNQFFAIIRKPKVQLKHTFTAADLGEGGPLPPLILVKKKKAERRKAGRASKKNQTPLAKGLDSPLFNFDSFALRRLLSRSTLGAYLNWKKKKLDVYLFLIGLKLHVTACTVYNCFNTLLIISLK